MPLPVVQEGAEEGGLLDAEDRQALAQVGIWCILALSGATALVLWAAVMIVVFREITGL